MGDRVADSARSHLSIAQENHLRAELTRAEREVARLTAVLNTPEVEDFARAVVLEAQHQRERWPAAGDDGKAPEDWFWLLGYLGGKALAAAKAGDRDKTLHHCISSAAMLANWHARVAGVLGGQAMRPGIGGPDA